MYMELEHKLTHGEKINVLQKDEHIKKS